MINKRSVRQGERRNQDFINKKETKFVKFLWITRSRSGQELLHRRVAEFGDRIERFDIGHVPARFPVGDRRLGRLHADGNQSVGESLLRGEFLLPGLPQADGNLAAKGGIVDLEWFPSHAAR